MKSRIVLHPSGKSVDCALGDTVLGALEAAGYALPNNCRAGACGECKLRVRSGDFDQGVVLDMALSPEERIAGYGLMCMAKPVSEELVIEWVSEDARPKLFSPRQSVLFVVVHKSICAARVAELHLRPVGPALRYWPGQYVTLGDDGAGVPYRAYSMANAPRPDGEIVLQVARSDEGGTSAWVHDTLEVGEQVKINGPYGSFVGDPTVDTPVLCLAAGTGLAPVLALAEAALRRGFRKPVTVLVSARSAADVYGRGMLSWWHARHRHFSYHVTLTREKREGYHHGRVDVVLPTLLPDLSRHTVFAAGSPEFVDSCLATVRKLGAQDALIHSEGFYHQNALADEASGLSFING
ncbi:2Fe-2S iron-sulfur cluster-binding protein [Accumulibacter sp.]|uniref:2Fe-2S iron-sulfur cluster-binding protein n=1 Tax=Accumulibacter sp. TaxID=2053492 RepID=UPI0028C4C9B0|nr:2Fe-2S iron-sulfur cluster-binding protein [Accumulibacter sp.]